MTNEAVTKKVMDTQTEFFIRLENKKPVNKVAVPQVIKMLHDSNEEFLQFTFGHIGTQLHHAIELLDLDHPEICQIFDQTFNDDTELSQYLFELMPLADYAYNSKMKKVFPLLGNLIVKEFFEKNIVKKLDTVNYNKNHVRLIKDGKERESLRLVKKMQVIDLQGVYKKGNEIWNCQPEDFFPFLRFDSAYSKDIEQAEKKMERYQELGCTTLANEIKKSVDAFRENMEQAYYGFNRITMTNAAIILAKLHGFSFMKSEIINAGGFQSKSDPQIHVDKSFFNDYNFDPTAAIYSYYGNMTFKHNYEPKIYPIHEMSNLISDEITTVIEKLEKFPDANHKPIFDHFGVIVPSISYKLTYINDESGIIQNFPDPTDAGRALDKILIKKKLVYPIIVGERNGKCYFICHWR